MCSNCNRPRKLEGFVREKNTCHPVTVEWHPIRVVTKPCKTCKFRNFQDFVISLLSFFLWNLLILNSKPSSRINNKAHLWWPLSEHFSYPFLGQTEKGALMSGHFKTPQTTSKNDFNGLFVEKHSHSRNPSFTATGWNDSLPQERLIVISYGAYLP